MLFRTALTIAALIILSGCAPSRFYLNLTPQPPVAQNVISQAIPVTVTILDARSNTAFGKRGDADLLSNQDLPGVLRAALATHLQQRGYAVRDAADTDTANLTVSIRTLAINAQMNKWDAKVDLAAHVTKANAEYKANYAVEKEGKVVLTPSAKDSETWLNQTLNEALAKMFSDGSLLKFLGQ